ncbi:hypothetical protein ACFO3E_14610 [Sphingobium tyrosinilyticum]|uniref:Uncharacterized protein n=1 Tax=Sphingobium tyrosinilyticum TaxID=2715436 RepID=A0ABV9F0M4_9SPHN
MLLLIVIRASYNMTKAEVNRGVALLVGNTCFWLGIPMSILEQPSKAQKPSTRKKDPPAGRLAGGGEA